MQNDNISYLQRVTDTLTKFRADVDLSELYVNVYDSCRFSRNAITHNGTDTEDINSSINNINKQDAAKLIPSWHKAFSAAGVYGLDDLVAYSAFLKRIADELSRRVCPLLDW